MDPSIVKLLEEDVDESMHSGADVDAFTAALNRDIAGPLPQGGSSPKPKELPEKTEIPSLESQLSEKGKAIPVPKPDPAPNMPSTQHVPSGTTSAEKKVPKPAPTIPFQMLMPILRPHLDKDRDMQLQQIFTKLRSNEVSKEDFLRVIRNIVGDQMLRQAAHTVHMQMQAQAAKSSQTTTTTQNPSPTSSTTPIPNSSVKPNPNPNNNQYSLPTQISSSSSTSSSQQYYSTSGFAPRASLGATPSPVQLQTESKSDLIRNPMQPVRGPQVNNRPQPPHQHGGMFGPSYPPRPGNLPPPVRPPTAAPQGKGQVAGSNWPRSIGSTFGPAYVKPEPGESQPKTPLTRDDFLGRGLPRIGAPGPGPGMIGGPGLQISHPDPSLSAKPPIKKPTVGQKKPMDPPGSSPPSKKQKTGGGGSVDQSIDQLNDVTAVSGVNLREEEEQLLAAPKEDSRISEATRRAVQEEEERLILQKGPLHKKLTEILAKCNLSSVGPDVERCLSMCVEERLKGIIGNLVRLSKQRVDIEKSAHRVVVTSDVHKHIMTENQKAKDEWDCKQAEEAEKLKKQNELEGNTNGDSDKDKDDNRNSKNVKVNKEEDDKMRTNAANVAARAAVGGDDMLTKWQMMVEQARHVTKPSSASSSSPRPSLQKSGTLKEQQEEFEKNKGMLSGRKRGKEGGEFNDGDVARSVCIKDVIAVLEREPQMAKSTLMYRLYEKVPGSN